MSRAAMMATGLASVAAAALAAADGSIRVTADRSAFRRAGFRFGPQPEIIDADLLTIDKMQLLVNEPALRVEIALNGNWMAIPPDLLRAIGVVSDDARGFRREAIEEQLLAGELSVHDRVRDAMLARVDIRSRIPGIGAGADHPASEHDLVEQPAVDPNPTLPAGGAVSDRSTAAELVEAKPRGPEPATAAAIDAIVEPGKIAGVAPAIVDPVEPRSVAIAPASDTTPAADPIIAPAALAPSIAPTRPPRSAKPPRPAKPPRA